VSEVKAARVPLEVNVPVTGTVKYISRFDEKPNPKKPGTTTPASWCLNGTFDWVDAEEMHQRAEGKMYITEYQMVNTPLQLGLAVEDGKWEDSGNIKYKWTYNQPVRISMRKEAGGNKLKVTITRLTELPNPTATGAESPPAASPSKGSAIPLSNIARATPVAVPPSDEQWEALARQYHRAIEIAHAQWGPLGDGVDMAAAAATVFIEANRRGLTVPAPHVKPTPEQKAEAIRNAIDKYADKPLPVEKGEEEDDSLPF
jgi:hypothetical protein